MITERLHEALQYLENLTPDMQNELAEQIEEMTQPLEPVNLLPDEQTRRSVDGISEADLPAVVRIALALGGAWRDLQDDDEFAALSHIRHANPPSPPIEEQLAWLSEDGIVEQ